MANDLNQCNFIGRLGKDPETRYTASGDAVTNFSLAVGEQWKDSNGQKQERTEWINVVAWRRLGEICGEYLRKGSQVMVTGKFATEKWQDQNGNDRYSTKIVANNMQMLDTRSDNNQGGNNQQNYNQPQQQQNNQPRQQSQNQPRQQSQNQPRQQQSQQNHQQQNPPPQPGSSEFEDDIPF